jgi:transposase
MVGDQRHDAQERLIATLRQGLPWHDATREAAVTMSRRTAYRLLRRVRTEGAAAAVRERRHGHAYKICGPVREWLARYCRASPSHSGSQIQAALRERFGLTLSVSQINRVRATLGLRRPAQGVGGKWGRRPAA